MTSVGVEWHAHSIKVHTQKIKYMYSISGKGLADTDLLIRQAKLFSLEHMTGASSTHSKNRAWQVITSTCMYREVISSSKNAYGDRLDMLLVLALHILTSIA